MKQFALLLLLVLLLCVATVVESVCSEDDQMTCYSNRDTCHWTGTVCEDGATTGGAAICESYKQDYEGCILSSTGCQMDTATDECSLAYVFGVSNCEYETTQETCNSRVMCQWVTGSGSCVDSYDDSANSPTNQYCFNDFTGAGTQANCEAEGCWYNSYLDRCYKSEERYIETYSCSFHDNFDVPQTSCDAVSNECDWTGSACVTQGK